MPQDAYEMILTCRAVRRFTDTPISDENVQRILQAGRWAGSAKNEQPWHFIVVREQKTRDRLAECGNHVSHLREAAAAVVLVTTPGKWAAFDAGRATQNMTLAAWAMGIGSCIASLREEARVREILGVPDNLQVTAALSFGYPLKNAPQAIEGRSLEKVLASPGRQPLEKLVHWETW